jgi:tRNA pseudouridine55 synthase
MAEGVLPVLLGRATRLADFIQAGQKTYVATMKLGVATDTDDATGSEIASAAVPPLSEQLLHDTLSRFCGEVVQLPPTYSALKVGGRRAYELARAGATVTLTERRVTIYDLRLHNWSPQELTVEVTCSKGTYIRALARDMAFALGTVGHLSALTRTRVGPFRLADSVSLDDLSAAGVASALRPASCAIPGAPSLSVDADQTRRLLNGQPISSASTKPLGPPGDNSGRSRGERPSHPCDQSRADTVWVYDPDGRLVCLASIDGALLRPRIVL